MSCSRKPSQFVVAGVIRAFASGYSVTLQRIALGLYHHTNTDNDGTIPSENGELFAGLSVVQTIGFVQVYVYVHIVDLCVLV